MALTANSQALEELWRVFISSNLRAAIVHSLLSIILLTVMWATQKTIFFEAGAAALLIIIGVWLRCFYSASLKNIPAEKRENKILPTVAVSTVGWALILFSVIYRLPSNDPLIYIFLMIASGAASGASNSLTSQPLLYKTFLYLMFLPTLLNLAIWHQNSYGYTLIGVILIYFIFLLSQAKQQHNGLIKLAQTQAQSKFVSRYLQSLIDSIPNTISVIDENKKYVMVNQNLCRLLGIEATQLLGQQAGQVINDQDFSKLIDEFINSKKNLMVKEHDLHLSSSNTPVPLLMQFTHLGEDYKQILIIGTDIKQLRETQKILDETRAQSINASRLASVAELAAGIAHEINNPITIIMGQALRLSRLTESEYNKETIAPLAEKITKMVERVTKIISGLKNLAADASLRESTPVSLKSVIEDAVALMENRFTDHGILLNIELDCDPMVRARDIQIGQVVINLLSNAFDAVCQKYEDPSWVRVRLRQDENYAYLEVTDCGPGIPEELREKIMNPFFTTKDPHKGTGLGLSLSQRIATEHRGELYLDTQKPNTTFVLKLPLERC